MPFPPMKDSDLIWQSGVVRKHRGRVWLQFEDPGTCSRCSQGTGCGAALFSRLFSRPGADIPLDGAGLPRDGQRVRAGLNPHWLMTAAAMLYLVPVLAFLVGALAADAIRAGDDVAALVGGLLSAFLAVWLVRVRVRSRGIPRLKLIEIDPTLESQPGRDHFLTRDVT